MNRAQPWAVFCLAIWITGTIFVAIIATQNFYEVDRLLAESPNMAFQTCGEHAGLGGYSGTPRCP
jgi:hypothetical protein